MGNSRIGDAIRVRWPELLFLAVVTNVNETQVFNKRLVG